MNEKKPRFMNKSGVQQDKNAPLSNNATTNNKQQQYTTNNTYGTNPGNVQGKSLQNPTTSNKPNFANPKGIVNNFQNDSANTQANKPNFTYSRGIVNNNTPYNADAKVEKQEVKREFKGNFTKSYNDNGDVKAPKKDYLDGTADVKYKEEADVNIEKRVFQSNKSEPNYVDIKSNQEVNNFFFSR